MRPTVSFRECGTLAVSPEVSAGLAIRDLGPRVRFDNEEGAPRPVTASEAAVTWTGDRWRMRTELLPCGPQSIELRSRLCCQSAGVLNHVELLTGDAHLCEAEPGQVRVLTLSRYGGDVVAAVQPSPVCTAAAGEPNQAAPAPVPATLTSENVMVVYDRGGRRALLIGFLSSERWQGRVSLDVSAGNDGRLQVGFDGGDVHVEAGEQLALETVMLAWGSDPWRLLEQYADRVKERHGVTCPDLPPVSWCSWYPYRLGVSAERLLAEARIAARRLKPLGLGIIEADLGWERQHLPHVFEPNRRFARGLRWLSEELGRLGFALGVWKAPFTISALDSLTQEHPDWVIQGEDGRPVSVWTWFWEPHGDVYVLDLTHPGAQAWLRENCEALHRAGVRYFKADFIGMAADHRAKRRHDPRIVAGGGAEAARIGARLIRDALPDALALNCGGPQMPGTGAWPLLYVCNDTGNTGLQSWEFARTNFRAAACHLWQNGRWGIIQTSCLCVGLPGTLEEARVRATAAFLSGGQVDISDTLTTLPEDRWAVLEATLPPLGKSATPIDLFEPVFHRQAADYEALCKGLPTAYKEREHPPGSVWHLRLDHDGDAWDLVAVFAFDQVSGRERPELSNFTVPLARLGLDPAASYWAYEFWSGQFLGVVPGGRANPDRYAHPGDWQDLVTPGPAGTLSLTFSGPAVKLLALRRPRPHPWVLGTSFHQSCGMELADVRWDPAACALSGVLCRPPGQSGHVALAVPDGWRVVSAEAEGCRAGVAPTAAGGTRLSVVTAGERTGWRLRFSRDVEP
ncbi:MAG: Melibiase [Lentisphaerae bacterium ADurb.BinA184]|nr:MAG: Melibiase [Lentisphaerae bacterium ADurb.BinA184]